MTTLTSKPPNGNSITINLKKTHFAMAILVGTIVGINSLISIAKFLNPPEVEVASFNWEPLRSQIETTIKSEIDLLRKDLLEEVKRHTNDEGAHRWITKDLLKELRENELKDIKDQIKELNTRQQTLYNYVVSHGGAP